MPDPTRRAGTWEAVSDRKEHLVNPRGVVIATVYRLRLSGRWACNKGSVLTIWNTRKEAREVGEG